MRIGSLSTLSQPLLPKPEPSVGPKNAGTSAVLLLVCFVGYLGSGISQPLNMSAVKLAGLGDTSCQLYMLPYYFGQACTGLLCIWDPPPAHKWRSWNLKQCAYIAIVSAVAQNLNYTGNMLAGSAVFAVIYSSATIWSAVLSRFIMQRVLTTAQWGGVFIVFFGLSLAGLGARDDGPRVCLGALLIGFGAMLHAGTHVLSEFISVRGEKIPVQINSSVQGLTACVVIGAWQLFYTLPNWDKISLPAQEKGTTAFQAAALLFGLTFGNLVHAATFFHLLAHIGTTSAYLMKALQAVVVFGLSHVLYCKVDSSQCLTPLKATSLFVVVSGVLAYAVATARSKRGKGH